MTDGELDNLERLRRERFDRRLAYDRQFLDATPPVVESSCSPLLAAAGEAERVYADAIDAAAPKLIAEVRRLRRLEAESREALQAYKDATGVVQSVAYADGLNRALARESERAAEAEAEVARLRAGIVEGMFYRCGCPAKQSEKIKAFCDEHLKPLVPRGGEEKGP